MKRRSFIGSSLMTGMAATLIPQLSKAGPEAKRTGSQYYELRVYTFKNASQQAITETFLKNAALPALHRMGIKHTGVFIEFKPSAQTRLFVLTAYENPGQFVEVQERLASDAVYQQMGQQYLNAPATEPAFERIENSLLKAFAHFPAMRVPAGKPKLFELRQYQSASENAGKKKIGMFNDRGEIDIFVRLGFQPVFFSETLIGANRPELTYMVSFEDMAAHDAHWKAFGDDTQWKEISIVPDYADALLVSKITSTFLIPVPWSPI